MLATRVLPPILRSPPSQPASPGYYNLPRIHEQSLIASMGDGVPQADHDMDTKRGRTLRKSTRSSMTRSTSSPSPIHRQKTAASASPQASPVRITRKRAASLTYPPERRSPEVESPPSTKNSYSAPSTGSGDMSGHVCLCQPEPKIPRPRNGRSDPSSLFLILHISVSPLFLRQRRSLVFGMMTLYSALQATDSLIAFILYRQHHQHGVVAHNPGLANPEISKIIGEKWRGEDEDVKRYWQDLADV